MSPPIIESFNAKLIGWPDKALTVALLAIAVVISIVAVRGKPYAKAVIATWLLAP